jgi:hypothetical protein
LIVGCNGKEEAAPAPEAPATPATGAVAPVAAVDPGEPPPPVPGDPTAPSVAAPTVEGPITETDPQLAKLPEMERLNWAVQAFTMPAEAPPLTNLNQLVKAGLIRSVPAPPPGKKFLIKAEGVEVVDGP